MRRFFKENKSEIITNGLVCSQLVKEVHNLMDIIKKQLLFNKCLLEIIILKLSFTANKTSPIFKFQCIILFNIQH